MSLILVKKPFEISFTGNPMPFIWQIAPYGSPEQNSDIYLTVNIYAESAYNSNSWQEIYVQKLLPAADGTVKIDIGTIVSPYLDYYVPRADLAKPVEATNQRRRFKISRTYQAPGLIDLPEMFDTSVIITAIKGGLQKDQWRPSEFFTKIIQEQKKPLLFAAAKEKIDPEALKFISWIYPDSDLAVQTVTYKVYLSDNTSVSIASPVTTTSSGKWSVHFAPAGFNQCNLQSIVPLGKSPIKYSIRVTTVSSVALEEYFFELDNRNFYEKYYLLYRNSIGALETMRLLGQIDMEAEYTRQQARLTGSPAFLATHDLRSTTELYNAFIEENFSYTGETGWLSREELFKVRDLFLSKEVYQIHEGRITPAVIITNKAKFFSNKDNLLSASIEWQRAFTDKHFTPPNLMPVTQACPALESFQAYQLSKNKLQFIWGLQYPYEDVEVQMTLQGVTTTYTMHGNTGMAIQEFTNPIVDSSVLTINFQVRTICNPDGNEYGPFTSYDLVIRGDTLPIAVDDYYQVPVQFAGWLSPSVLANDYDPDGDDIEVVPISAGAFGTASRPASYEIDSNGNIRIWDVPPDMVGKHTITYQIHNPASAIFATGHAYITFGDGPQAIFIKWVYRNQRKEGRDTWAEAWLDYFSDPACTVPVDLTGRNINVLAKMVKEMNGEQGDVTNYNFIAAGTKQMMWSGYIINRIAVAYLLSVFTVLPGTGYTPINP